MTSSIYTGAINGTGNNNTTVLYNNDTGGNVRIIWYYFHTGTAGGGSQQKMFIGGDPPADGNVFAQHEGGQNMNTVEFDVTQQSYLGTNMGITTGSQNTFQNASGQQYCRFPIEVMLANGHKLSFWTNPTWGTQETALEYNFIVIPE